MDKKESETQGRISRRNFLGVSLTAAAGVGLAGNNNLLGNREPAGTEAGKIEEYRTLGRTGFQCSDISFGSSGVTDPAFMGAVLDSGINYIDSSESYVRGQVERTIGQAMKGRDRKSVFISTKLPLGKDRSKQSYKERALKCLERLQMEHIDCLMIHGASTVEALKTEGFHAAITELKAEGKVRFCGLSNHGAQWGDVAETMDKVHLAAAEDGRFDVALLVYNFVQREAGEKILKAYKAKNVGTTIMKSNPVLNYQERQVGADQMLEEGREPSQGLKDLLARLKSRADLAEGFKKQYRLNSFDEIRSAAIRFVIGNPDVNCVCPTILSYDDLNFYVSLSGKRLTLSDNRMLSDYTSLFGEFYCRHACGECESECPYGVPVNTIMRYHHYFSAQRREKYAMDKYESLTTGKANLCSSCSGHCAHACPHQVPIQGLLMMAHRNLTLSG
jgi:predicted aldo/keto reductase-like oxidoreductase